MDTDNKLLEIESRLERMHNALQRQEVELESWRGRSVRVPNWITKWWSRIVYGSACSINDCSLVGI